jgi:hypothetical protein
MNEPFVAIERETIERLVRSVQRELTEVNILRKEPTPHSVVRKALDDEFYALQGLLSNLNYSLHSHNPFLSPPKLRKSEESFEEEKEVDF